MAFVTCLGRMGGYPFLPPFWGPSSEMHRSNLEEDVWLTLLSSGFHPPFFQVWGSFGALTVGPSPFPN